jgi:hypothetical protein
MKKAGLNTVVGVCPHYVVLKYILGRWMLDFFPSPKDNR